MRRIVVGHITDFDRAMFLPSASSEEDVRASSSVRTAGCEKAAARTTPRNVPPAALRPVEGEVVACGPYCSNGFHSIVCSYLNGRRP